MQRVAFGMAGVLVASIVAGCGTGSAVPNGVEAVDCMQDDPFELGTPFPGNMMLAVQDRTFKDKMTDPMLPQGAFVTRAELPAPRCGEADVDAQRLWTVSQYTRWGHSVTVPATTGDVSMWEGLAFWAKAFIDLEPAEDRIVLTGSGYEAPRVKDEMTGALESDEEYRARLPKPIHSHGMVRVTVGTPETTSRGCDATAPPEPPPLQVQDGSGDCYDSFTGVVHLSERWQLFTLPFSEMRQSGWGKPAAFMNTKEVGAISITIGPFADYDFLVDDVSFYRRRRAPAM